MKLGKILILKWLAFLKKGSIFIPRYVAYWGARKALVRISKAAFLPAIHGIAVELANYFELSIHQTKLSRSPEYIIMAPDFVATSAGIWSLYKLCDDLRSFGFETAICGSQKGAPNLKLPLISKREAAAAAAKGAWVICPEVVAGNPLGAKNVIRWVLNRPGLLGGEKKYSDDEHIFVYSNVYEPYVKNKICGKLYRPMLDQEIFYPPERSTHRSLTCYYVGKSKYKSGHFNIADAFEITRSTPAKTELGKLFRASKLLYCFDNSTALIYEALLCGCPVVIIPDGTQTWEDFKKLELGTDGISWGISEETTRSFDPKGLVAKLSKAEHEYYVQLTELVRYSQALSANHTSHVTKIDKMPHQ